MLHGTTLVCLIVAGGLQSQSSTDSDSTELRILLAGSEANWEVRYLANLIKREEGMKLKLITGDDTKSVGAMLEDSKRLESFDLIILGKLAGDDFSKQAKARDSVLCVTEVRVYSSTGVFWMRPEDKGFVTQNPEIRYSVFGIRVSAPTTLEN